MSGKIIQNLLSVQCGTGIRGLMIGMATLPKVPVTRSS